MQAWRLVTTAIVALGLSSAQAATFYVRPDGGDIGACDGLSDSASAGKADRHCAWRHPFDALPPGGPARIAGGDVVIIGAGSYPMGRDAEGAGQLEKCRLDWPWDCHMAPVPSGTQAHPTRILGAGYDRGCGRPPELWGTQHASTVIDLSGSSHVEIACLEITDHSSCIEFHKSARQSEPCEREHAPYGAWASAGISASDSAAVELHDLNIHGLAHDGIRAGRLRDWSLERVRIAGNGWAGWSGDLGSGDSGNNGRMSFHDVEIAWNGCGESYPGATHFGCWGEDSGGYGDGLGTSATGGNWIFDHVDVHHNAQDGIDLLHANPDARIELRSVHARANAGNQVKASGSVRIEQSTIQGNCTELGVSGALSAADLCRARGNSIELRLSPGIHDELSENRISGEGDCLLGVECTDRNCADAGASIVGNQFDGAQVSPGARRPACSAWADPDVSGLDLQFRGNTVRNTRNEGCPQGFRCEPASGGG